MVLIFIGIVLVFSSAHIWKEKATVDRKAELVSEFHTNFCNGSPSNCRRIAQQMCELGDRKYDDEFRARGLVRLVFSEMLNGKWNKGWKSRLDEAQRICAGKESIATAELLLYRGFLKGQLLDNAPKGLEEIEESIRIASQFNDDALMVLGHWASSQLLIYVGREDDALEKALRGVRIAETSGQQSLKHLALKRAVHVCGVVGQDELETELANDLKATAARDRKTCMLLFSAGVLPEYRSEIEKEIESLRQNPSKTLCEWCLLGRCQFALANHHLLENSHDKCLALIDDASKCFEESRSPKLVESLLPLRAFVLVEQGHYTQARAILEEIVRTEKGRSSFPRRDLLKIVDALGDNIALRELGEEVVRVAIRGVAERTRHSRIAADAYWEAELKSRRFRQMKKSQNRNVGLLFSFLFCLAGIVGVVVVALALRNRQLRANAAFLQHLVQERTAAYRAVRESHEAVEKAAKSKSEFLACMNHEIRNPLQAIIGYSEIFEHKTSDPEDLKMVSGLRSASEHLMCLVDDVLEVSKIEDGTRSAKIREFDLFEVWRDVSNILSESADSSGLQFTCDTEEGMHKLFVGDDTVVRQALMNLLGNAIKFTETGFVNLKLFTGPAVNRGFQQLHMVVTDSGPGIPAEFHDRIFEPFAKLPSHQQGKGLGMYITKSLVESIGGTIRYDSQYMAGARFCVTLPMRPQTKVRARVTPNPVGNQSLKVVVMDDKANIRDVVCAQLEEMGHQARSTQSVQSAIDSIRSWDPDVVLLDLRMPGKNGFEVLDEIRDRFEKPPVVVAMSGDATSCIRKDAIDAGFDGFIPKPFNVSRVHQIFSESKKAS